MMGESSGEPANGRTFAGWAEMEVHPSQSARPLCIVVSWPLVCVAQASAQRSGRRAGGRSIEAPWTCAPVLQRYLPEVGAVRLLPNSSAFLRC